MTFSPGQLLLVEFPFTDHTSAKIRPVLVVSAFEFNRGEDFVGLPLTSRIDGDPFSFPILSSEPYFSQTLLRCDSAVKWTKPMPLSSKVVRRRLGSLPEDVLRRICELVASVFVAKPPT